MARMTAAQAKNAPIADVAAALMQQFNVEMNPDTEDEDVIRARFSELANSEAAGKPAAAPKAKPGPKAKPKDGEKDLGRVHESGYVEYHPKNDTRVWIRVAREKDMPEHQTFTLNGFTIQVRRGKWANIPRSFLNVIRDARQAYHENGEVKRRPRFNVEVYDGPDKPKDDDG